MRRIATALWLAAALIALLIPSSASAAAAFGPVSNFGGTGAADGQFNHPQSAAVDSSGAVFVADTGNGRVEKFNGSGTFQSSLTATGLSPQDVAVDGLGNIYVSSPNRVDVWTSAGVPLASWTPSGSGTIYGIAVDSGNVYVSDTQNSVIRKYPVLLGSPTGPGVVIGSAGSGPGQMLQPQGLTMDASNILYVADPSNNRIDKFNTAGSFQGTIAMPSYVVYASGTFAGVVHPQDVAVDGTGRVFAPDTGTHSNLMAVFDSAGTLQQVFGSPDSDPSSACQLRGPWGAAIAGTGPLYVVSTGENLVRVFDEAHTACPSPNFGTPPPSNGGSLPGGVSPAALAADRTKPSVRITGLPRRCARKDFVFVVNVADDVLVSRIALFVQKRRAASQEVNQQQFFFRVRIPVNNVRRQIPRGFIYRVLLAVKATDLAGHTTKVKRKFGICGAG